MSPAESSSVSSSSSCSNSSLYQALSPREVSGTPRGSITTGFVIHLIGEEETHALHEGYLDRVCVFEYRQVERGARAAGFVGVELNASLLPALVEVTQLTILERRRPTLDSVDLDVLTTIDRWWIDEIRNACFHAGNVSPPPPP
jgi:hypothetical protein